MPKLIFLALFFSTLLYSQEFQPPQSINILDKNYLLAYQAKTPNGFIYEYTTDKELVENWTTLATLNYFDKKMTSKEILSSMEQFLKKMKNPPLNSMQIKNDSAHIILVFEPRVEHMSYETTIQKSFHPSKCNGTILFQYATRTPVLEIPSKEQNTKIISKLYYNLNQNLKIIENTTLSFECN